MCVFVCVYGCLGGQNEGKMKRFSSELSTDEVAIQSIEQFIGAIVAYKSLVTLKLCTVNLLLH